MIQLMFLFITLCSFADDHSKNWGVHHIGADKITKVDHDKKSIVVAVVDTGVDFTHPDLTKKAWTDPLTGTHGWDFLSNNQSTLDAHGHGTHVAGIITSVAPVASIMSAKYYSESASGATNLANSIKALNYAIDHNATIINYSGGGAEFSLEEYNAIKKAGQRGILIVVAAGNEASDIDDPTKYYYPCAYRQNNTICVSAINIQNKLLSSSNWGKTSVDLAAPGENILSTAPGGKYAYMSGTSQATAFVSGVAALIKSKNIHLSPRQIKEIIVGSVDEVTFVKSKVMSGGRVSAVKALRFASLTTVARGKNENSCNNVCDITYKLRTKDQR